MVPCGTCRWAMRKEGRVRESPSAAAAYSDWKGHTNNREIRLFCVLNIV